jgi:hypothetical protein
MRPCLKNNQKSRYPCSQSQEEKNSLFTIKYDVSRRFLLDTHYQFEEVLYCF